MTWRIKHPTGWELVAEDGSVLASINYDTELLQYRDGAGAPLAVKWEDARDEVEKRFKDFQPPAAEPRMKF